MKPRLLRIKSIPEQYIEDVFNEFYRLDSIISDGNEYQRNYVVTRLVTIIEQFFRIIVEDKLYDRNGKAPEPINLDPDIIDKIASIHFKEEREITRELVMSLNYKFQSGDQIKKTMKDYGMRVFRDGVKKTDYDELFELRHKIVHTLEQPPSKIRKYYEQTEKLFEHVLGLANVVHPSFYLLKIEALVGLGHYDKAVECFKDADRYSNDLPGKSSKSVLAYYDRAVALQFLGEYERAVADFDRAASLAKNDGTLYSYMGMRLRKSKDNDGIRLLEFAGYNKGVALQEINDHDAAIKCFNMVLKMDPNDINARLAKGESLLKLGKTTEARDCIRNSVWVSEPINAFAYHKIAKLLLGMDDLDESAKCFARALTLFNDNTDSGDGVASYGKGILLQDLGDDATAVKCFDKSIEEDPNDVNVYVAKGLSLLKLGNYAEAKDCFGLAAKVGLNNAYAYFGLGMSPLMLNEREAVAAYFAQALALFETVLKVEPNDAMLHHYKGAVLREMSKPEAALECFDKAIELDPNYADAYRSKGNLLQDLDDHDDAMKCFSKITKLDKRRRNVKRIVDRLMDVGRS